MAVVGAAVTVSDVATHRLPNAIIYPSYAVAGILLAVASLVELDPDAFLRAIVGGPALCAAYFAVRLAHPAGMGLGDVKLAGLLGTYLATPGGNRF